MFSGKDIKENIIQSGDYYANLGEWNNAIVQYYEFLYRFSGDSLEPVVLAKIFSVYWISGRFDLAEEYIKKAIKTAPGLNESKEFRIRYALYLLDQSRLYNCYQYCQENNEEEFILIKAYSLIQRQDYARADSLILNEHFSEYKYIFADIKNKDKKPLTTIMGIVYGLIPGADRILDRDYLGGVGTCTGFVSLVRVGYLVKGDARVFSYVVNMAAFSYFAYNFINTIMLRPQYNKSLYDSIIEDRNLYNIFHLKKWLF